MGKKIKSAAITMFGLALTGAVWTGCGERPQAPRETQQSSLQNVVQETQQDRIMDETETEATATAEYEDNFAVDSHAAKEFANQVKVAAADKDLEALAELTAFPVYVGLPDVGVVETKEEFLKLGADSVFTEELLQSVEAAEIEELQPSMAGFSISDGGTCNINFGVVDGNLAINGMNY